MKLFGKRVTVFEVRGDKPRWKAAKQRLKDAGIRIMESGSYEAERPAGSCCAKLDNRNFGPNGHIDRLTYYIMASPEDSLKAQALLVDLLTATS